VDDFFSFVLSVMPEPTKSAHRVSQEELLRLLKECDYDLVKAKYCVIQPLLHIKQGDLFGAVIMWS